MMAEHEKVVEGKELNPEYGLREESQDLMEEIVETIRIPEKNEENKAEEAGKMRVVERIQLEKSEDLYRVCHLAKSLYNRANFLIKTALEKNRYWVRYLELYRQLKTEQVFQALPTQTSQQILQMLDRNWKAFFKAIKDWKVHPEKYAVKPEPPGYKPKDGESLAIFTNQQCRLKEGCLYFPKKMKLPPVLINPERVIAFRQVRLLPRGSHYLLEIVYDRDVCPAPVDPARILALDLGLNNIVCGANNVGLRPFVVKGGAVKSINQFYNKMRAKYQSLKDKQQIKGETKRLQRIRRTRNNKIEDLFHQLSRAIINYCVQHTIGTIVVGYNEQWKTNCHLGKKNNQNFVSVPFHRLVHQLQYKATLVGIEVQRVSEAHTSKCSFLDGEPLEHHDRYVGTRIKRGLFRTQKGQIINADLNGSYNIMRKAFPEAITVDGIAGLGLVPYSVKLTELNQLDNLNTSVTTKSQKLFLADGIGGTMGTPFRFRSDKISTIQKKDKSKDSH